MPGTAPVQSPTAPPHGKREISLGSNEGVRTVTLRDATIEWRRRKSAAAVMSGEVQVGEYPASGRACMQRRPLLSIGK
jgi:hypothetical protein